MLTKNQIIKNIYYQNFENKAKTLAEAKQSHPLSNITKDDVDDWFRTNPIVKQKQNLRGYNSFVPDAPLHVFEIDLFHYNYEQQDFSKKVEPNAIICIDAFTKYVMVLPIKTKSADSWRKTFDEFINKMGKPKIIYTDPDASLTSNVLDWWFAKHEIKHVITRNHATMAERAIRTFKHELDKRIEVEVKPWTQYIDTVLNVINNKNVHSTTGYTPAEALKPENEFEVRNNIMLKARHDRKYPSINIGDVVRVFRKRKVGEKERHGFWKDSTTSVTSIIENNGQYFYKVEGEGREFIRGEILFIKRPDTIIIPSSRAHIVSSRTPSVPTKYISQREKRTIEKLNKQ